MEDFYDLLRNSESPNLPAAKAIIREVVAKPRMHDVARPPRPCRKGEGALATAGFATTSIELVAHYSWYMLQAILVPNLIGLQRFGTQIA